MAVIGEHAWHRLQPASAVPEPMPPACTYGVTSADDAGDVGGVGGDQSAIRLPGTGRRGTTNG